MKRREDNIRSTKLTTEAGLWRKKRKVQANGLPDLWPALAALAVFPLLFREDLNSDGSIVRV
jgi:hypothetical protein